MEQCSSDKPRKGKSCKKGIKMFEAPFKAHQAKYGKGKVKGSQKMNKIKRPKY
jgi:hypothetical protein